MNDIIEMLRKYDLVDVFDYFQIIPFTDICTAKLKTTQQIQTNCTRRDQSEEGEFRQL